ncbi:hypothetical protein EVAR_58923_1 [Eumeta japonica]|uniref:Uncharacterized protein n=1 Tax=Eumeta variegata TaxID=151549 RepID=A0A4C1Y7G2_EUMVA|nr:hypothetical protein EVAR_58923_1 [Eumeta japonica]
MGVAAPAPAPPGPAPDGDVDVLWMRLDRLISRLVKIAIAILVWKFSNNAKLLSTKVTPSESKTRKKLCSRCSNSIFGYDLLGLYRGRSHSSKLFDRRRSF